MTLVPRLFLQNAHAISITTSKDVREVLQSNKRCKSVTFKRPLVSNVFYRVWNSSRALHTWLCSWRPTHTSPDCLDHEYTLRQRYCIAAVPGCRLSVKHRCLEWKRRKGLQRSRSRSVQRPLWIFSCPCIPVETYLRLSGTHTNSVLQGTYRQLTCF